MISYQQRKISINLHSIKLIEAEETKLKSIGYKLEIRLC